MNDELDPRIKELIAKLTDLDPTVRSYAVDVLGRIGLTVKSLIQVLRDPDKNVRSEAVKALERIAKFNSNPLEIIQAVPPLIQALNDQDVRLHVFYALKEIIENTQPSLESALTIKRILNSKELIRLASIDRNLYIKLFNAFNAQLRKYQIAMDGELVEPPKRFVRTSQQAVRSGGKHHV